MMKNDFSSEYGWAQLDSRGLEATELAKELKREAGPKHALFDVSVKTIRRRGDDVLFEVVAPSQVATPNTMNYAEVHLTWCNVGPEEDAQFPTTQFFASLEDWHSKLRISQHGIAESPHTPIGNRGMTKITWILLFMLLALLAIAMQI